MTTYKLTEMTRADLKAIVYELTLEVLWEWEQEQPDPDAAKALRPEIAAYLTEAIRDKQRSTPVHEVIAGDDEVQLSPGVQERLRQYERGKTPVKMVDQVERELGLDE